MPKTKYHTDEERQAARKEQQKEWRERNKQHLADYQRKYASTPEGRQKRALLQKQWRQNNPERYAEIDQKCYANTRSKNRQSRLLSAAKERAKLYNLPFNITHEDIIIPEHCPVLPWIKLKQGNTDTRPELDRIVPEKGYVKGNVQIISGRANRIKHNASAEELRLIYEYVKNKS